MWVFILDAIMDSVKPTILLLYKKDYQEYERKNRQLYAFVFYASVTVSLIFLFFGDLVVEILYGESYKDSVDILKVVTWYTAFSYLGAARSAWIVSEGKQKYLKYMYIWAVFINIGLNLISIPYLGAVGAALASLVTQIFTGIILPLLFKPMRRNAMLMIEGILLKNTFSKKENKDE
jgi:O-antigen/teichoic acid export membrane protein